MYDRLWRGTVLQELHIDRIRIHLTDIRELVNTLTEENEMANSLKLIFLSELNNNQTKFGLAGIARNVVNTHIADNPSAVIGLTDYEMSVLNEQPQYSLRGGKSKRKRSHQKTRRHSS